MGVAVDRIIERIVRQHGSKRVTHHEHFIVQQRARLRVTSCIDESRDPATALLNGMPDLLERADLVGRNVRRYVSGKFDEEVHHELAEHHGLHEKEEDCPNDADEVRGRIVYRRKDPAPVQQDSYRGGRSSSHDNDREEQESHSHPLPHRRRQHADWSIDHCFGALDICASPEKPCDQNRAQTEQHQKNADRERHGGGDRDLRVRVADPEYIQQLHQGQQSGRRYGGGSEQDHPESETKLQNPPGRNLEFLPAPEHPAVKNTVLKGEVQSTTPGIDQEGQCLAQGHAAFREWCPVRLVAVHFSARTVLIRDLEIQLGAGDKAAVVRVDRYADILIRRNERPAAQRCFTYLADDRVQRLELYLLPHSVAYEQGNPPIGFGCNGRRW